MRQKSEDRIKNKTHERKKECERLLGNKLLTIKKAGMRKKKKELR